MTKSWLTLAGDEATDDIRPRSDGLRVAGRDPAQPGLPVRSPTTWVVACCPGYELSQGCGCARRFASHGGVLGASVRGRRIWRAKRQGADWSACSAERERTGAGRGGSAAFAGRLRPSSSALGWASAIGVSAKAARSELEGETMPAAFSAIGISVAQTPSPGGEIRSSSAGRCKKNSANWRAMQVLICGL